MNIFIFLPKHYDYAAATLIEGLSELGYICGSLNGSNYSKKIQRMNLAKFIRSCELVIVVSGNYVDHRPLKYISKDAKIAFIDGSDFPNISPLPNCNLHAIFKRELLKSVKEKNNIPIHPFSFGIEKRYISNNFNTIEDRKYHLSFIGSMNNFLRNTVDAYLKSLKDERIFTGQTGERAYNGFSGSPLKTGRYFSILQDSFASIDIPGYGWDCARTWEILACGALLIKYKTEIVQVNPLISGKHFIEFANLDDLKTIISFCYQKSDYLKVIANNGHEFALKYHTSVARARYFIDILKAQKSDDFYTPYELMHNNFKLNDKKYSIFKSFIYYSAINALNQFKKLKL